MREAAVARNAVSLSDLEAFVQENGGRGLAGLRNATLLDVYYDFVCPQIQVTGESFAMTLNASDSPGPAEEPHVLICPWEIVFTDLVDILESCEREAGTFRRRYWVDFLCMSCPIAYGARNDSSTHEKWAAATREVSSGAAGAVVVVEAWDRLAPFKTMSAMHILYSLGRAGKRLDVYMSPGERDRFKNVVTADQRHTQPAFALPTNSKDYDARSLPGGLILRDELMNLGWDEVHREVSHLLTLWLHAQLRQSAHTAALSRMLRSNVKSVLALLEEGNAEAAVTLARDTYQDECALLGEGHVDTLHSLYCLGLTLSRTKGWEEARSCAQRSFEGYAHLLGPRHTATLQAKSLLGECALGVGDYDNAEGVLQSCLQAQRDMLPRAHPDLLQTLLRLGQFYNDLGKSSHAEAAFVECLQEQREALGEDHPATLATMLRLAFFYSLQRRVSLAEATFSKFLDAAERTLGTDHKDYRSALQHLAHIYLAQGKFDLAEPLFVEMHALSCTRLGEDHPTTLEAQNSLGNLYQRMHQAHRAEQLYADCSRRAVVVYGKQHPVTLMFRANQAAAATAATAADACSGSGGDGGGAEDKGRAASDAQLVDLVRTSSAESPAELDGSKACVLC